MDRCSPTAASGGPNKWHFKKTGPPPSCATFLWIKYWYCNTCCCKKGKMGQKIHHELIHGSKSDCTIFMTVVDALARTIMGFVKAGIPATEQQNCFKTTTKDRKLGE